MIAGKADATYVVFYKSGERSGSVGEATLRALIESGRVGVEDLVSRDNGPPAAYNQYDEFVDLWDVDESFDFFMGASDEATDPEPGPGRPIVLDDGEVDPLADFESFIGDGVLATDPTHQARVGRAGEQPSPFLPGDAAVASDPSDTARDADSGESIIAFEDIDAIAGFGDGSEAPTAPAHDGERADDGWLTAAGSDSEELGGFSGYDPLADLILDPMTVLELLYDSSLYSVLAANPGDRRSQIEVRYRGRADIMAKRQRGVARSDQETVLAMREIRQLVYKTYQVLLDDRSRAEYNATASRGGSLATAAQFFEIDVSYQVEEAPPAPAELIAESLAELEGGAVETLGEQGASLGLSNEQDLFDFDESDDEGVPSFDDGADGLGEPDRFGIDEELFLEADAPVGATGSHAVDFSDEYEPYETQLFGAGETPSPGVRIYTSVSEVIDSGQHDDIGAVGELFDANMVPRAARIRRETAARMRMRRGSSSGQKFSVTSAAMALEQEYPDGLRWGADDTAAAGATQAASLSTVAFLVSLAVVIVSDLGVRELDYSGHSFWFWGRGLLLITLAVAGTLWIRGEPIQRVGLLPPVIETVVGLGIGVVLGLAASMIAPIYLETGASLGTALAGMFFIAVAHEIFFRGFVTRVLLVALPSPYTAILISCLIYGFFYLSYSAVLGQSGFWVFYYSVLLYGFGLGSVLALLYWKSRSIWPSVMVHFLVLAFAAMLAPGAI